MKRNFAIVVMFILLAYVAGLRGQQITSATPYAFGVSGTLANCPVASITASQYCFTVGGEYAALASATWTCVAGPCMPVAGSAQLTINGTTKTLPGPFTISATVPAITSTITAAHRNWCSSIRPTRTKTF